MAGLTVKIDSGDGAFATDSSARAECVRLLRRIADRIEGGYDDGPLHDYNGNRCGQWDYEAPEADDDNEDGEG